MRFKKSSRFSVIFLSLISLCFVGCIRVNVETSRPGAQVSTAPPYSEQTELKDYIRVSRFNDPDTQIDISRVDAILAHASLVAHCGEGNDEDDCSQFDTHNDFGCKITYISKFEEGSSQAGGISQKVPTFIIKPEAPTPSSSFLPALLSEKLDCLNDGVICSQEDLDRVWHDVGPQDGVKIVRKVQFCEEKIGSWLGCAEPAPSRAIVVKRGNDVAEEGVLWLHERGHNMGLCHTTDYCGLNPDPGALMAPEIDKTQTKLNGQECFILRQGRP